MALKKHTFLYITMLSCFIFMGALACLRPAVYDQTTPAPNVEIQKNGQFVGELKNPQISECSGIAASPTQKGLIWAINDGGNGPYVFAMKPSGEDLGRIRIRNSLNRDWEGLDAFTWQGESYLLIADIGDNKRRYNVYQCYIIEEPVLADELSKNDINVDIAWQIKFDYPDGAHNAEGVAVDEVNQAILVLTKGDLRPKVFEIPLFPFSNEGEPIQAKLIETISCLPAPTLADLSQPYGNVCSEPTAMDISGDGHRLVVLTYTQAYLFERRSDQPWAEVLSGASQRLVLPSPYTHSKLRQREAICFSTDDRSIYVTSEGLWAGIYRLSLN